MICNDAYDALLQGRQPPPLGTPFREVFHGLMADLEPLLEAVLSGQPQVMVDQAFAMPWRKDQPTGWFTFSLVPLRAADGAIAGFMASTTETTGKVKTAEALAESDARQAILLELSDALRSMHDPGEMTAAACRLLGEALEADRVAYAEVEGEDDIVRQEFRRPGLASMAGRFRFDCFRSGEPAGPEAGRTLVTSDVEAEMTAEEAALIWRSTSAASYRCRWSRKIGWSRSSTSFARVRDRGSRAKWPLSRRPPNGPSRPFCAPGPKPRCAGAASNCATRFR